MKKHLRHISTASMSRQEWLDMRLNQVLIGGSDVGTVMGQNPWKPALKLFHQKIGLWPSEGEDTKASYGGRVLEEVVAKHYWRYWSPDSPNMDTLIKNANEGKIIRKCNKVNFVAVNPDFPWLAINMDREYDNGEKCLEIKTGAGFAVSKWETGLPVYYITQHQACLGVAEMLLGEVALYVDGRDFDVFPFSFNEIIFTEILKQTKDFYEKVVEGKAIMGSDLSAEKKLEAVTKLEPAPEGTASYEEYMKERYRPDYQIEKIAGTKEMIMNARMYLQYNKIMNTAKETKTEAGNRLRNFMSQNNANEIDFGTGSVTWTKKSNGHDNFRVSPKIFSEDEMDLWK